jgi:hypothetical protein
MGEMVMLLLIVRLPNKWVMRLANTNKSWNFQGVDLDEQEAAVEYLATSMQGGVENVVNNIYDIVEVERNVSARETVQALFGQTDGIQLNDDLVFNDADNVLLDVLDEAGTLLFAAL